MKIQKLWYFLFFALIIYLLMNTGIVSDDISYTISLKEKGIENSLLPRHSWLTTPIENYTHVIWYHFFCFDDLTVNNAVKIAYILLCFYFATKFFGIYFKGPNIFLASFLFIFFPSHDSTVYWFLGQHLTLSISIYLFAYYLAYNGRILSAFLAATIASFISYGTVAIAFPLFLIFLLDKKLKRGMVLFVPNVIYIVYYIFVTKTMSSGIDMIPARIGFYAAGKQFILQALSFFDAVAGPSIWLKMYYSFFQLSITSIIAGVIGTAFFYKFYSPGEKGYNRNVLIGFLMITTFSFILFTITGRYPQMAFNLGNRATIFGSLLVAYLLVIIPMPKMVKTLFFAIMLFSVLGISEHWKDWNLHQMSVMQNIESNEKLKNYQDSRTIYVSGNQYSKYGPISHIEFLSAPWVTNKLFKFLLKNKVTTEPINKSYRYEKGFLIDKKYNIKQKVRGFINVYDSEKDRFFRIEAGGINAYIDSLPPDNRHWVQIIGNKKLKNAILRFMPRVKYAF